MNTDSPDRIGLVRCRCLFCGASFFSKRGTAQFCSASHKQKMYRWRLKLDNQTKKCIAIVKEIGSYLTYDQSTPSAVTALNLIVQECFQQMNSHNVKRVK